MEIERKFRIKFYPKAINNCRSTKIEQSYLSFTPEVRLRSIGESFFLTIKGEGTLSRTEKEIKISEETYLDLIKGKEGQTIVKTRYYIDLEDGNLAEVDIFGFPIAAYSTIEVEFKSVADAIRFNVPDWFGEDVTQDSRFKNKNVAKAGM